MALTSGAKLGPYEILSAIGAGGMGEVYRARDFKLNREVALKVLPAAMANDAERMERFQHGAQVLLSLNHPNIASIHGLEDSGGVRALVMELVEGPTLAELLETRNMKAGLHGGNYLRSLSSILCRSQSKSPSRSKPRMKRNHPPRFEARQREDDAGGNGQGSLPRTGQSAGHGRFGFRNF